MLRFTKFLAVAGAVGLGATAFAGIPDVRIDCWTDGGYVATWHPTGVDNGNGTYSFSGSLPDPDGDWTLNLQSLLVDADPFINAVYGLTNNANITQNFTLVVSIPVAPQITPSSLMGGSTGGSITDANGDGVATAATLGLSPFYSGTIDGVGALSLHASPFSVSAPFAFGTANIPAVNAGLPGPTLPGPAVLSDIGITHRFSLTAHDTIGITSAFQVVQFVPEPAAVLMLGALAVACRRR
jgi:hypothetical protein